MNPETGSSPDGWVYSTNTSGNNALAFKGAQTNVAVETSPDIFAYYHDETTSPATPQNLGAAIANAFYGIPCMMFSIFTALLKQHSTSKTIILGREGRETTASLFQYRTIMIPIMSISKWEKWRNAAFPL